ncbi:O-antigen ligase family protein [Nocardioides sp. MH1]|uniref:O-antigen ligase family protein n=1 Tax=Nocardioides sp. MH1 TaxID=3242490 RepID=UPI00352083F6
MTAPSVDAGNRHLVVAIAAAVVLLPFGDWSVPVVGLRLTYVAMAVPAAMAFLQVVRGDARLPASLVLVGSGLGMAGGVVSAALGVAPDTSIPLVVISVLTLGYATAIVVAYRPGLEVDGLDLLVVVGGVVAVLALTSAGSLEATDSGTVVSGRLTGPFSQPNELGAFCAILLPIAVACLVTASTPRRAAVIGASAACLATACVMSMSRGSWIGALVALIGLAVCEPATRRALTGVALAILATCAAALAAPASTAVIGVLGARIRSLGDPTQNEYDDRPLTWAEAFRQATEHPWFGVGPGGFQSAAGESRSVVSADPADHPHDLFLTVLADRGVIGMALGVLVVVGCVIAVRRHLLGAPGIGPAAKVLRTRSVAVIGALTVVMVHGAFDMPLRNPIVSGLVWTLLGSAMVAETCRVREERTTTTRKRVTTCP